MPSQNSASFFGKANPEHAHTLFSCEGRLGRLSYIARFGFLHFLFIVILSVTAQGMHLINWNTMMLRTAHLPTPSFFMLSGGSILFLLYSYLIIVFMIRRLHDLNQSGWMSLLLLIPMLNLLFGLYLVLARGTPHANNYGVVPHTAFWEKLCAWLMILLFLISLATSSMRISYMMGTGELDSPPQIMKRSMQYF
ncbi:DUF805 domain-containing protein [Acinetobacter brisouii]|jgi:uncharacterized membrane protein YhaH (DUF805 family)|uniref:DUF805 domain-containing protein n=1 Tax=Acinetobacter brisouii TaxID=396323 RepID=UPI0005F881E1|nr:DUF805 domain-containing protein [Acinetobacter brisouii]KJV39811.1 hypothetical protein VH98_04845 [Acinetobacter brisouii]